MDESRFDAISQTLGTVGARRVALQALIGTTMAAGLAHLGLGDAAAKHKHKKKRHHRKPPKLHRNEFGCVNVGQACRGKDTNCCSGICQGPVPKHGSQDLSVCVAHNELDCAAGADNCQALAPCGNGGLCYRTTGQAGFCSLGGVCSPCKTDTDCEAAFGPGAACGVCATCPGGTLCAPPKV
jgi:hypothetical protein